MNYTSTFLSLFCFLSLSVLAQPKEGFIYASMEAEHARELKATHSDLIDILKTENNLSSVYIHPEAAHELHQKILSHGPGYMFHANESTALVSIQKPQLSARNVLDYTITHPVYVRRLLDQVDHHKIEEVMQHLESYGTRYHTHEMANQAAEDLKVRWENMIAAANRSNDVSVRIISHQYTPMKTVALTIMGHENAHEYVIVGGHLDSTVSGSDKSYAPGSDDNASGIATLTEILRVLLANDFKPQRTVEFMAYAAEEVGLVGSNEIATQYANAQKNVIGYVQFDMTAFKGSPEDVYVSTDSFTNNDLNLFLYELMEEYNSTGAHQFTYGNTTCNYGCSDHYSWATKGFPSAFPFEASFNDSNPFIHTTDDRFEINTDGTHAAKFAKLGLEFVVEAAKLSTLSTVDVKDYLKNHFHMQQKALAFDLTPQSEKVHLKILDARGAVVTKQNNLNAKGLVQLSQFPIGYYIAVFETSHGEKISHKFVLQ